MDSERGCRSHDQPSTNDHADLTDPAALEEWATHPIEEEPPMDSPSPSEIDWWPSPPNPEEEKLNELEAQDWILAVST